MDDGRRLQSNILSLPRVIALVATLTLVGNVAGCSLAVMTGKMLVGDPKRPCAFSAVTRVNLVKEEKKVLVICSAPESIKMEFPSLEDDLHSSITRHLKIHDIQVVNSNKVTDWIEENGGVPSDSDQLADELAEAFETDYIIIFDLDRFAYTEENSPTMYQGQAEGQVLAYEVRKTDGGKSAMNVFSNAIHSVYPRFSPRPAHQMSKDTFVRDYLRRVSLELSQLFYDHHVRDEMQ